MTLQYPKVPSVQTRPHFKRLLWRAGFFGSRKHLDHYVNKGLGHSVQELLTPFRTNVLVGEAPTVNNRPIAPLDEWGHDCLWWLDRMVRSRNQLVERMTLNLHDLFATSNSGVGNTRHMLRQNRLLRSYALGNFATLLQEITHDPAMLLWLNGVDNRKDDVNENYARELMELFTLGAGRGYTERDVREMARALTGFRNDWSEGLGPHNFRYDREWHDHGFQHFWFAHSDRYAIWNGHDHDQSRGHAAPRGCLEHRAERGDHEE